MHHFKKISTLTGATLLFPIALVLFEFAVYIANDMVQPAMLLVTQEFGVGNAWVPVSMTAFTLGGAMLTWLTGPWSDRAGRRPVMLAGASFFILTCLATYAAHQIESFLLLRILQGTGLCFIASVGYAVIQEAYEEKTAVQVTALMGNVGLLAPMIGPLAGAALISVAPWRSSFLIIAVIALLALIGLWRTMPETVDPDSEKTPFSTIIHEYIALFSNGHFVISAVCIPILCIPLVGWIAISPVILVDDMHLSMLAYGLWQLPVFGCIVLGNLFVAFVAKRWPLGRTVLIGVWPILLGVLIIIAGLVFDDNTPIYIVTGISLISFALGLSYSVLYRFTLMSSELPKGIVSAGISLLALGLQAAGIEVMRIAYVKWGMPGFSLATVLLTIGFVVLSRLRIHHEMALRADEMATN